MFDFIEGCAGLANLTKSFKLLQHEVRHLDKKYNPQLDFSSPLGLRLSLIALRRLKTDGVQWWCLACKLGIARRCINTRKRLVQSPKICVRGAATTCADGSSLAPIRFS